MAGFIHVPDTHIVAPGKRVCGRSDTREALRRAIATINAKLPILDGIECVIVTGDLTDHGMHEEYAHFASLMAGLDPPRPAVPRHQDPRPPNRAAFPDAAMGQFVGCVTSARSPL